MRRSEREITDKAEIMSIIEKCDVCRLGLSDGNIPYVVPMNYGYEYAGDKLTLYFHSAKEGRKLDIIARNPMACFEMDCSHRLVESEQACSYTMEYDSIIGSGKIHICSEKTEKITALSLLMQKYAMGREFNFPDQAIERVTAFRLDVTEFAVKQLRRG